MSDRLVDIEECDWCGETRPIAIWYEDGDAPVCGPCLASEVVRLRAEHADARKGRADSDDLADMFRAQREQAEADLADAQRAQDRVWKVVQALRDLAQTVSGDPYNNPVGQVLSAALVNHEDFGDLLAALSAWGTDPTGGGDE